MLKHKYQFTIFEYSDQINNSAATKAVADCNKIFTACGYKDFTLTVNNDAGRKAKFYLNAFLAIIKFLIKVERGSVIGIQYPMLNNVFKYFIKAAKIRGIKFFCVTHDIESLRLGGTDRQLVSKEITNLNFYDCLIVHNDKMLGWLKEQGIKSPMVPLYLFDYLSYDDVVKEPILSNTIVFAGNLSKSIFVYDLNEVGNWKFNLYGPNIKQDLVSGNATWQGVYSPNEVVQHLTGDFGLIWDGESIEQGDEVWGNYLKYNNPHKFSLYLAAGLPVIAPRNSAIGKMITEEQIGFLIDSLHDLNNITIDPEQYRIMKNNCLKIRRQLIKGDYFKTAVKMVEKQLSI